MALVYNSDDSYVIKDDIKDNFVKVDMASSRTSSHLGRICTEPRVREELQICFIVSVLIVVCLRLVFFFNFGAEVIPCGMLP